jgi:hypothetical protein
LCVAISLIKRIVSAESLGLFECGFDLRFQTRRKSSRGPREIRLRLDEKESLFPAPNHPGQQHQEKSVGFPRDRSFHLSLQDDQLVPQQRVFCHQFSFVSCDIGKSAQHKGGGARFHPTTKAIGERVKAESESLSERCKNREHNILLCAEKGINV